MREWENDVSRTTGVFPESLWVIYTMTEPTCTTEEPVSENDTSRYGSPSTLTRPEEAGEGGGEGDGDGDDVKVSVCVRSDCLRGRGHHRVLRSVRH